MATEPIAPFSLPPLTAGLSRTDYARLAALLEAQPLASLRPLRCAVLASYTLDLLKPNLLVEAARRGLGLDLWLAPFGQIEQQALDPQSELHHQKADVVLILPRLEDMSPELSHRFLGQSGTALAAARENLRHRFRAVLQAVRAAGKAKILLGNFTPPLWSAAETAETALTSSQQSFGQQLNDDLAALCREISDAHVFDAARVAMECGLARWQDERLAYLAKAPFSAEAMLALGQALARRMRSLFVPPKKCLVLDLDNTLWGGVLGEAGWDGIALGPDYPGNVFVDFQKRILALRDRGVLLAVASKNNAADVEQVFQEHPSCLLKREHFAALEIHWEDKATSLRRIAAALNIGMDALVFFDDNAAEREWVRSQLPEVTVIEVPAQPLGYARALADCGCFDFPALTKEDLQRAALYQHETQRQQFQQQAGSLEDFLRGLAMKMSVGRADETTLPRIAQLLAKTNQFNLTTRRHSAAEIQAMIQRGGFCFWVKLQDKFGDLGLIGAAIAVPAEGRIWRLDTFLMSCRVIGRGMETAMLALVENFARQQGAEILLGEFTPTNKNQPAAAMLPRHGYEKLADAPNQWRRLLDHSRPMPDYLTLEDHLTSV